ncbi:MAG: M66 family metalloprotease [Gemmatimonadota bacterium]|nr:M66 family metalloprotease [Gemmatimonadota bacterium]MDE2870589.1 M66 family metalloprotease [Gemmatimonadota bacterium]
MRKPAGSKTLPITLLAGAVLLWSCADLRPEADRIPTRLAIVPDTGLLTAGTPTKLKLVVEDQHGEPLPVPGWSPVRWGVFRPATGGHVAKINQDGMLTGLRGGRTTVTARVSGLEAEARFRVNPERLRLTASAIYLTQGAQNRHGSVRLIAGRPGLLRIFVVANEMNWGFEPPAVQVTLLQGNDVVLERLLPGKPGSIPTGFDESDLRLSFNVEVPGSVIQPGLRMVVELDPEGVVPLAPGSRTRYPETGSTELVVVRPPLFRQVFVPTLFGQSSDPAVFAWLDGIGPDSDQMRYARNLLPVSEMEVEVRDTFRLGSLSLYGWLNAIRVLHVLEGRRGYYYGATGQFGGGVANFARPWSVGAADAWVYTHETGHNMNLYHANCGGAVGQHPKYPYPGGSIGVWGYDVERKRLYDPAAAKDVMSYCRGLAWTGDFQFDLATTHRLSGDGGVDLEGGSGPGRGEEMLVVWGSVRDGELTLDPAFVVEGPVELPEADGPYRVEGIGADGETRFSLSFSPTPLEHGGGSFVYFVPYDAEWASALDRMVLTGPEGAYTMTRDGEPEMAVLTDRSTGLIQAIFQDWDGGPIPGEETAEVTTTRGIPAARLR